MTTATKIRCLILKMNAQPSNTPLREQAAVIRELRALGWGRAA